MIDTIISTINGAEAYAVHAGLGIPQTQIATGVIVGLTVIGLIRGAIGVAMIIVAGIISTLSA